MVLNALNGLRDQTYQNFVIAAIDDGSDIKLEGIIRDQYPELVDQTTFYYNADSVEYKREFGSRHGLTMNEAIHGIDADFAIFNCDDDVFLPDYLEKLNQFYKDNPEVKYSYCHITDFDPFVDKPGPELPIRGSSLNHTHPLFPSCTVDASQVNFSVQVFRETGIHFPQGTINMDATIFDQLRQHLGVCVFNGILGQYKACFPDQMTHRYGDKYTIRDLP